MADRYLCMEEGCLKQVASTANNRYRSHQKPDGTKCPNSSVEIPASQLDVGPVGSAAPADVPAEGRDFGTCGVCRRKVKLTKLGYLEDHDKTLRGGDRCENGGTRWRKSPEAVDSETVRTEVSATAPLPAEDAAAASEDARSQPNVETVNLPEDDGPTGVGGFVEPLEGARRTAPAGTPESSASPESETTSIPSPEPEPAASPAGPFSLGTAFSDRFLQPFSPFLQPTEYVPPVLVFLQPPEYGGPEKAAPMSDLAKELATKIKETFYSYSNRKSSDNRSAQTTLGPSEIGTPCDRRLAMSLMGIRPVNAGGDGWAAFVGTWTHAGMAEVYTFADAGTGRYAVELPVFTGSPAVPRGTTDLLDRRDATVVDWKVMGVYSLKKFKADGPSPTYRTQAHVYALAAERGGERVKNVAIVGLPRAGSSLDEMHVWTEKYDRKFAQAALDRVERIAGAVDRLGQGPLSKLEVAEKLGTADDCRFCPFHLKGDKEMLRGCPGK